MFKLAIPLFLAFAPSSLAHGHVRSLALNSKTYTGYLPVATPDFNADAPSISRKIGANPVDGPVKDLSSNDITCNFNATPINDNGVSRTGPVTAGTNATFHWNGFTHTGPIFTYMAKCDPDCGSFTGSEGAVWFKVHQRGYENSIWATQLLHDQSYTWYTTIPTCLAPGEYLLRHEIIALSNCKTVGECQFYPSCHQVTVISNGTASPTSDYLVSFPGTGYSPTEPGILWDTNTQLPADYVMPGAPLWTCL